MIKISDRIKGREAIESPNLQRPNWALVQARSPEVLWLDKNENNDPQLLELSNTVLRELPKHSLCSYPESGALYKKLAKHVNSTPENILITSGSDGGIRSVFDAFINPGDGVVLTNPTFAMYSVYVKMYSARPYFIDYAKSDNGPRLDVKQLLKTINDNAVKLVCLPNPDSPTGTVINSDELNALLETTRSNNALLLIDEAYYPFYEASALSLIADNPNLIVVRSTGKAWGMAGLRIGYAVADPSVCQLLHKVKSSYETNTLAVNFFLRMLDHYQDVLASVQRLQAGKAFFVDAMKQLGLPSYPSYGNFCHIQFGQHADAVHKSLENIVYYRKDFSHPALAGYSRFSSTTRENFVNIVETIQQVIHA